MRFLVVGDGFVRSFIFVDVLKRYFPDADFIEHEVPGRTNRFTIAMKLKCSGNPGISCHS